MNKTLHSHMIKVAKAIAQAHSPVKFLHPGSHFYQIGLDSDGWHLQAASLFIQKLNTSLIDIPAFCTNPFFTGHPKSHSSTTAWSIQYPSLYRKIQQGQKKTSLFLIKFLSHHLIPKFAGHPLKKSLIPILSHPIASSFLFFVKIGSTPSRSTFGKLTAHKPSTNLNFTYTISASSPKAPANPYDFIQITKN